MCEDYEIRLMSFCLIIEYSKRGIKGHCFEEGFARKNFLFFGGFFVFLLNENGKQGKIAG